MLQGLKNVPLEPLERGILAAQILGHTCSVCAADAPVRGSDVCLVCEARLAVGLRNHLRAVAPDRAAARMDEFAMRFARGAARPGDAVHERRRMRRAG